MVLLLFRPWSKDGFGGSPVAGASAGAYCPSGMSKAPKDTLRLEWAASLGSTWSWTEDAGGPREPPASSWAAGAPGENACAAVRPKGSELGW